VPLPGFRPSLEGPINWRTLGDRGLSHLCNSPIAIFFIFGAFSGP
jgi:hypothetical protein